MGIDFCEAGKGGNDADTNTIRPALFIPQKVFIKSFCKSQFPHKFVNLSFIITKTKNKLTDLWGHWLLQNDFIKTLCEMQVTERYVDLLEEGMRLDLRSQSKSFHLQTCQLIVHYPLLYNSVDGCVWKLTFAQRRYGHFLWDQGDRAVTLIRGSAGGGDASRPVNI